MMLNNYTEKATVEVDGKAIEEVEKYVYLGKTVKGRKQNHEKPQSKHADQEKVFTKYFFPVMPYGSETAQMDALAVAQRKM